MFVTGYAISRNADLFDRLATLRWTRPGPGC